MQSKSILVLSRKDIYHPNAWWAEQIIHIYMKWLINAWYAVTQIAPQFSWSSKSEQIDWITIKRMFSIHTIYFAFWTRYLFVRNEQYDLIIDHAWGIPLLSPLYVFKKPIVFFTHHIWTTEREDYFKPFWFIGKCFRGLYNHFVLKLYRKKPTITVSQWTAQELRKLGFQNIHVLPNTTDYPRIEFTVQKKELILTTVGRVVPNKQFSHALYLLKTLHNGWLPYHLHIVWAIQDKNEYVYLENIIKTEQLNSAVTFDWKLWTQELIALWDKSRYWLILSDKEWFWLTTLEANSRGVPMLGYSIPGVNEVIHDWENWRLLPKNDRNEWAQRIIWTWEEEYTKLVKQTVQFITTYPTWEWNQNKFVLLIKSECKVNNRSKNLFNRLLGLIPVSIKQFLKEKAQTLSDRNFLTLSYFLTFWKILNLTNPKTYTEKIQWFKLHQTDKVFSDLADKFEVRSYVQSKIKDDILIPLYRHWTDPEEIPFETLPKSFVIKCNHGSGYNIFVKNKNECDINAIKIQLQQWLAIDFWKIWRELQYKNIEKQIVIEQLLIDEKYSFPVDYKFYCFDGKPLYVGVITGRYSNQSNDYYDIEWNKQPFSCIFPRSNHDVEKPTCLQKMIDYASLLSAWFPFMRVDFYQVNGKVYFGEITFTPDSGYGKFEPNSRKIDSLFGDLIILPKAI
jgi:glycosyltransferase involved in cell wall biosynthesis